jgi:hypothetical protein
MWWEDNIKMDIAEIVTEGMDLIHLAHKKLVVGPCVHCNEL